MFWRSPKALGFLTDLGIRLNLGCLSTVVLILSTFPWEPLQCGACCCPTGLGAASCAAVLPAPRRLAQSTELHSRAACNEREFTRKKKKKANSIRVEIELGITTWIFRPRSIRALKHLLYLEYILLFNNKHLPSYQRPPGNLDLNVHCKTWGKDGRQSVVLT